MGEPRSCTIRARFLVRGGDRARARGGCRWRSRRASAWWCLIVLSEFVRGAASKPKSRALGFFVPGHRVIVEEEEGVGPCLFWYYLNIKIK